jgi:transposase-like protein
MLQVNFLHFISLLPELTDSQITHVEKRLQGDDPSSRIIKELERRIVMNPECPHCHSTLINRHGNVNNMQRYRCKIV